MLVPFSYRPFPCWILVGGWGVRFVLPLPRIAGIGLLQVGGGLRRSSLGRFLAQRLVGVLGWQLVPCQTWQLGSQGRCSFSGVPPGSSWGKCHWVPGGIWLLGPWAFSHPMHMRQILEVTFKVFKFGYDIPFCTEKYQFQSNRVKGGKDLKKGKFLGKFRPALPPLTVDLAPKKTFSFHCGRNRAISVHAPLWYDTVAPA